MPYRKPPTCMGCPFYTTSEYFVPDVIRPHSSVALVAQNPGEAEEHGARIVKYEYGGSKRYEVTEQVRPQPLIGATGYALRTHYWPLTQLGSVDDVSLLNVIKCRPYGKNELPPIERVITREAIKHCLSAHFKLPPAVKSIMALGQVSLFALTRQKAVSTWRGYALSLVTTPYDGSLNESEQSTYYGRETIHAPGRVTVMPTLHIAALYKGSYDASSEGVDTGGNKRYMHAVLADFVKFGKLVRQEWPQALPAIYHNTVPDVCPSLAAFDTEYHTDTGELIRWSLTDRHGVTYVCEADYRSDVTTMVERKVKIVAQNLLADLPYLVQILPPHALSGLDDTMLAHSVLWTGEPHSLDYILSIYGSLNRHKHLATTGNSDTDILYSGLDSYTTLIDAWQGMLKEFKRDPLSWQVYKKYRLPLLGIINRAESKGIATDKTRLTMVQELFTQRMAQLQSTGRQLMEDEMFNLGSQKQVAKVVYT